MSSTGRSSSRKSESPSHPNGVGVKASADLLSAGTEDMLKMNSDAPLPRRRGRVLPLSFVSGPVRIGLAQGTRSSYDEQTDAVVRKPFYVGEKFYRIVFQKE